MSVLKTIQLNNLPSGWRCDFLTVCLEKIIDYRGKTPKKSKNGIITLSAKSVKMGKILYEKAYFISKETYSTFMVRGFPKIGDILLTTEAPLGCVAKLDRSNVALGQRLITLRGNKNILDNRYLLYYLMSTKGQYELQSRATGTTVQGIKRSEFEKVKINLPPLTEQKAIAHILGKLDDKIELNRQINQTLETMVQTLFKSWFVDFDPVIDNAIKSGNKTPKPLQHKANKRKNIKSTLSKTTQALFPDSFVFNDKLKKWIPQGWEVKSLDEIAHFQNGLALQKLRPENETDDFLPVLKIAQLRQGNTDGKERARVNIKKECFVKNADIIFSWSGSLMIDVWCGGDAALNQHLFKVTSTKYPSWFYYLWTKYHLKAFIKIADDKAVTMGHIKREHLSEVKCTTMDDKLFCKISSYLENNLNKQIKNKLEAQTLTKLRDTLLPKLISGKIRVKNINFKR